MLIAFADPSMEVLVAAQSRRVKVLGIGKNEEADEIVGHRAEQCC